MKNFLRGQSRTYTGFYHIGKNAKKKKRKRKESQIHRVNSNPSLLQNVRSASRYGNWAPPGSRIWARPLESCTASNANAFRYVLKWVCPHAHSWLSVCADFPPPPPPLFSSTFNPFAACTYTTLHFLCNQPIWRDFYRIHVDYSLYNERRNTLVLRH